MMMMAKGGGRSKGLVRGVACPDLGCSRAQVSLCCTYATSRGSRGRAPGFSWGKESRERGASVSRFSKAGWWERGVRDCRGACADLGVRHRQARSCLSVLGGRCAFWELLTWGIVLLRA